jgi:sec-independent protein translocase protein TatC
MDFFDHLEELRWHLVRSLVAIVGIGIALFLAKDFVFNRVVLGPGGADFYTYRLLCRLSERFALGDALCVEDVGFTITNIRMAGQFTQHIFVSFIGGFVVAFPYVFFEIWRFVRPGLSYYEKQYARGIVFFSSLLFLLGVLFGYFVLSPMSIRFLGTYQVSPEVGNSITLESYIGTLASVVFASAVVFELPMVVYFLARAGLIYPATMRFYRRHAFVVVLILSAVLTPPDLTSQLLLSLPFLLLYELSIKICGWVSRKHQTLPPEPLSYFDEQA